MMKLIDTEDNLLELNKSIANGFGNIFNTQCSVYSDIQVDVDKATFILLDDTDLSNPIQFLTSKQVDSLLPYTYNIASSDNQL